MNKNGKIIGKVCLLNWIKTTGPIFYIWATLTYVNVTRKCFWLLCVCIWFTLLMSWCCINCCMY